MPEAVLGLGGNLGARRALFKCARALLSSQPGLSVLAASPLYHTPPLGPPQPEYLNAALRVRWVGTARGLLAVAQHVEALLLRARGERWGPRTLDVDLLWWSEGAVREPTLCIPHPELRKRPFACVPLLDVAPELAAPLGIGRTEADPAFALSEPFPEPLRPSATGTLRVSGLADPLELISACVEALGCFQPRREGPLATLPFMVAQPGVAGQTVADAVAEMARRVEQALGAGFDARWAAVTSVGEGRCSGILVGTRSDAQSRVSRGVRLVESDGEQRLEVTSQRCSALWP